MKIAIVTPPLKGHLKRGTGTYMNGLVEALKTFTELSISVISTKDSFDPYDIIHFPYFDPFFLTIPLRRKRPTVVTVHDLIPIDDPVHFKKGFRGSIIWKIQKRLLTSVQAVCTDSESSKQAIIRNTTVRSSRIHVIYLGVNDEFRKPVSEAEKSHLLKSHNIHSPFLLYVGDINYNKNVNGLLMAFKAVIQSRPDVSLVLTGPGFSESSIELESLKTLITELNLTECVRIIKYVPIVTLKALYQSALAYIQPSFREGFGLPVVEAWASRCPVIASKASSVGEITGDAGIVVDPDNPKTITNAVLKIAGNDKIREKMIKKGLDRLGLFSWRKAALKLQDIYQIIKSG